MKNIETRIGERIPSLIDAKRLFQREFANSIDLPARTVGRIERGEVDMGLSTLIKIATALKVNLKDLIP